MIIGTAEVIKVLKTNFCEYKEFRANDIVKIKCSNSIIYEGRITSILDSYLMLDRSEKYKENVVCLKYKGIEYMKKVDENDIK